ncbi:MAG: histidine kinase [Gammaproteobacteria bacterium]|nr:histidine kinase [Gammaproteobacteria bacterium]
MGKTIKKRSVTTFVKQLSLAIVFNIVVALILTAMGGEFSINIIYSQSIGLSIFGLSYTAYVSGLSGSGVRYIVVTLLTIVIGAILGSSLAEEIFVVTGIWDNPGSRNFLPTPIFLGLLFGGAITYFFHSRLSLADAENRARQEALQVLQKDRDLTEAQLKLVQAQIEPHFLFNTLANIRSLMEHDVETAKTMLDHLNRYLRISLDRTRDGNTSLCEELDIVENYLSILQLRMRDRLKFSIRAAQSVEHISFPPLLIQPLVENAVKHGLEPRIEGGRVDIVVEPGADNKLIIQVIDTGLGLETNISQGIGLSNIRQRLASLYGEKASLHLGETSGGGVTATINIPLGDSKQGSK